MLKSSIYQQKLITILNKYKKCNKNMTNSTLEKVYKNIKKLRNEKGYSQMRFAELTGLSEDYISLIENGKRTPSLKRLIIIANVLEVDAYKLLM